jgi:SAM-dependent methyltransferase
MSPAYVHGYDRPESVRLQDQAASLVDLLHGDTRYPDGSTVLEAGCGVGAQTVTLARNSPGARITAVDIQPASLAQAEAAVRAAGLSNVAFQEADLLDPPFPPAAFDHVFVCFVLEHLPRPAEVLGRLARCLRPGGTLTAIEGDHGSAYFHPDSEAARRAILAQVELQRLAGGDALVGRRLHPLMREAGLAEIHVSPRMVYVDGSRPDLADGFTRRTFAAMIEGVREPAVAAGLTSRGDFDAGLRDLHRAAEPDGVFCYTFFKATGRARRA